jgi:hypothetical protein
MFGAWLSKITLDYSTNGNLPRHFPNLLRQSKNSNYLAVTISKQNARWLLNMGLGTRATSKEYLAHWGIDSSSATRGKPKLRQNQETLKTDQSYRAKKRDKFIVIGLAAKHIDCCFRERLSCM